MLIKIVCFYNRGKESKPDMYNCIQIVVYKCAVSTSQQTSFASGLVVYAVLPCRNFDENLSRQVCQDKIMSRKIIPATNVRAIWDRTLTPRIHFRVPLMRARISRDEFSVLFIWGNAELPLYLSTSGVMLRQWESSKFQHSA
ncbi:hypothetical protein AVEN_116908-1 [Araneus ventricosus]|uniref:Uncharacterized protein n=1 Tax=Araneus ventricosus TaxID=182803 RepID=A0A4Y2V215_ARAVE|nr:hypothetical protein AVEN_116908-1 [Araneus ventricosus]